MRAVRGDLPHAVAVAAECHQAGDDGSLAEAHVAHDNHTSIGCRVVAVKMGVHFLEEPLPPGEERISCQAGHLEQKGLEGDIRGAVGGKTYWREREEGDRLQVREKTQDLMCRVHCTVIVISSVQRQLVTHRGGCSSK